MNCKLLCVMQLLSQSLCRLILYVDSRAKPIILISFPVLYREKPKDSGVGYPKIPADTLAI